MSSELKPGDLVRAESRPDWPVWKVHAVHEPTTPGEPSLVSIRPSGKPLDKSFKGWPAGVCHTIRGLKVEKVGSVKSPRTQPSNMMHASVTTRATLRTDEIVESLNEGLSHEQLLQFMKDLDDRVCDLAFTKALAKHFAEIVKRERAAGRKKAKP